MTALEKAHKLFDGDPRKVPELAVVYAKHIARRYGGHSEGVITAYCVYAQIVLGLKEEDPLYKPDKSALIWFREWGHVITDNIYEKMWYMLKRNLRSAVCPSKDGELAIMAVIEKYYIEGRELSVEKRQG